MTETSPAPKPPIRVNPDEILADLPDMERDEQIAKLEEIHQELMKRLNRAQA